MAPLDGLVVLISRYYAGDQRGGTALAGRHIAKTIRMGSGLKFCRLAEGDADLYPRPGRTMEWDTIPPGPRRSWRERKDTWKHGMGSN